MNDCKGLSTSLRNCYPVHPMNVIFTLSTWQVFERGGNGRTGETLGSLFPPRAPFALLVRPKSQSPSALSNGCYAGYPYSITMKSRSFSTLDKHAWKKYGTALPLTFLCLVNSHIWCSHWRGIQTFFPVLCLFICLFVLNHTREWNSF